jgi:hypothetical protein
MFFGLVDFLYFFAKMHIKTLPYPRLPHLSSRGRNIRT